MSEANVARTPGPAEVDLARYERGLREQGFSLIAGVDEAGRGALAGPLFAAAVILPDGFDLEGVNDSKLLTAAQREDAYERIVRDAIAWSVCKCMPQRIGHRGLDRGEGVARSDDVSVPPAVPGLWLRPQPGLRDEGPSRRVVPLRAFADS